MEKHQYTVTLQGVRPSEAAEETEVVVEADSRLEAAEKAIWDYGESYAILAVDFAPEGWGGEFSLWDTSLNKWRVVNTYASKADALRHSDHGGDALYIAMPHLSR